MSDEAKVAIQALQWLCMFGLALYTYISSRIAARSAEVNKLSERVVAIEEQLKHLPDPSLLHSLDGDMKAIKAELGGLREALTPLVKSVDRLHDYLLNHK